MDRKIINIQQLKVEQCQNEIAGILAKHNCAMVPRVILSPGRVDGVIDIVPVKVNVGGDNGKNIL